MSPLHKFGSALGTEWIMTHNLRMDDLVQIFDHEKELADQLMHALLIHSVVLMYDILLQANVERFLHYLQEWLV